MYSLSVPKENNDNDDFHIEEAIGYLMDQYGNDVLRTSFMYLKDRQRAEDAFQEVFIKVYNKYKDFRGESSEKTWIIKITINVCKDMLRSSWLKRVITTDQIASHRDGSDVEDRVIQKSENELVFNEVLALPPAFKDVVILYYYHRYDTAQISEILKTKEGTVRSRLHRARAVLKSKLGGRFDLEE